MNYPPEIPEIIVSGYNRETVDIGAGWSVVVETEPDPDWSIFDDGDWFGRLDWAERCQYSDNYVRPDWADGSARLLRSFGRYSTVDGVLWWLPPREVVRQGPDAVRNLESVLVETIDNGAIIVQATLVGPDGTRIGPDSIGGCTGLTADDIGDLAGCIAEGQRDEWVDRLAARLGTVPAMLEGVGA